MYLVNIPANLTFVALPVPEIIGGTEKNLGHPWIRPHSLFSKIFHGLVFGWTLWMYRTNLPSVALAVPEIIVIAVLGWGCEPQSWGMGGRRRSEMVPFERALVTSYRLSIVTFLLSLLISESIWSWSTNVTDGRVTCNLNTALCTSASHGKSCTKRILDLS